VRGQITALKGSDSEKSKCQRAHKQKQSAIIAGTHEGRNANVHTNSGEEAAMVDRGTKRADANIKAGSFPSTVSAGRRTRQLACGAVEASCRASRAKYCPLRHEPGLCTIMVTCESHPHDPGSRCPADAWLSGIVERQISKPGWRVTRCRSAGRLAAVYIHTIHVVCNGEGGEGDGDAARFRC